MNSIPVELRQAMYCKAIDLYKQEQAIIIQKYFRRWLVTDEDCLFDQLWFNKFEMAIESSNCKSFEIEFPNYTKYESVEEDTLVTIKTTHHISSQQNLLLRFDTNNDFINCVDFIYNEVHDGYMLFLLENDGNHDCVTLLIFDAYDKLVEFKNELEFPQLRRRGEFNELKLLEENQFVEYV